MIKIANPLEHNIYYRLKILKYSTVSAHNSWSSSGIVNEANLINDVKFSLDRESYICERKQPLSSQTGKKNYRFLLAPSVEI